MPSKRIPKILKALAVLTFLGFTTITIAISWRVHIDRSYAAKIHTSTETISDQKVAVILGAAAHNFQPSDVLKERLLAGIKLYQAGKVEKLLMSGDNRFSHYNEPEVMRDYAIKKGVPAKDIVLDYAGRRTYDTCFRAKHIFQLDEAIMVTNGFHLPRTLYLCENQGMKVTGFNADIWQYPARITRWWEIRETIAVAFAFGDANIFKPTPILGEPLPIN